MKTTVSFVLSIIATSMVIEQTRRTSQERTSPTPEEAARATEKWLRDSS